MNEQDYQKILTKAGEDDDFVQRFFSDPAAGAAELGIMMSEEDLKQVLLRLDEIPDIDTPAIDKAFIGLVVAGTRKPPPPRTGGSNSN